MTNCSKAKFDPTKPVQTIKGKEWINVYGGDRMACTHMEKDRALNACKLPNGKYGKDYVCTLEITRINGLVSKVDTIQINWENSNAR